MAGVAAFGTLLKMGSTPTTVVNVTNISGPGMSTETIDVTAHDSSSAYREIVASFISAGEVTVDFNFDPSQTTHKDASGGIIDVWKNRTLEDWNILFPDGTINADFDAYITAIDLDMPHDDKLGGSMTLSISGAVTWAYV